MFVKGLLARHITIHQGGELEKRKTWWYCIDLKWSHHEHGLSQEASNQNCKVCQTHIGGNAAYVCHECPLVLCFKCANDIFYGNKAKEVHPHPLALRVRNAWKCDLCKQHFKGTASFYCKGCDFDACSRCYVGF